MELEKSQLNELRKQTIGMLLDYKRTEAVIQIYSIELMALNEGIEDDSVYYEGMAVAYNKISSGKTNKVTSPVEDKAAAIEARQKFLRQKIRELKSQNQKINHVLDTLPSLYSKLLRERYIDGNEWKDVTRSIGYSYSQQYVQKELNEKALNMAVGYLFPDVYNIGLFLMLVEK